MLPHNPDKDGWLAHPWADIEARYKEATATDLPWLAPMADLVGRIRRSGIDRSLHGIMSMYALDCMMHERIYFLEPRLRMEPQHDRTFRLTFVHPHLRTKDDWTATYAGDRLAPAVSRFLARVGWIPESHPAHAILVCAG